GKLILEFHAVVVPTSPFVPRANPLLFNILHVSTFGSKILRGLTQARPNKLKDLAALSIAATWKTTQNVELTPTRSRFYVQLLSIQRFYPCSPAKVLISKDQSGANREGYTSTVQFRTEERTECSNGAVSCESLSRPLSSGTRRRVSVASPGHCEKPPDVPLGSRSRRDNRWKPGTKCRATATADRRQSFQIRRSHSAAG